MGDNGRVRYLVESSWISEDKEKRAGEYAVVVADYGEELGTEIIAVIDTTDFKGVENLIETVGNIENYKYLWA